MDDFIFADAYRLEEGPTKSFYEGFLRGFVHKHNNLMTSIQGFASLALLDERLSGDTRENLEQILHSVKEATDLNGVALATGIGRKLDLAPTSLDDLLGYWNRKAVESSEEAGVPCQIDFPAGLPPVLADRDKLTELYSHLLANAVEGAARVSGGVELSLAAAGERGERVDLVLRNASPPLDERALREAFEPFDRAAPGGHHGVGLTAAAILAGGMGMRLGLGHSDGTTTAWLTMPAA